MERLRGPATGRGRMPGGVGEDQHAVSSKLLSLLPKART